MDAGDSLSASNGSEFSSRTDDRTGAGCPGMHDDHPGWYESHISTERFAEYTLKSKIGSYSTNFLTLVRFKHMGDRCTLANVFGHVFSQNKAFDTDFQGLYWSTFRESIQLTEYR